MGHNADILCLTCIEPNISFVSGSSDHTARLWSVKSGQCLRVFSAHVGAVSSVSCIDQYTFLTGSKDASIKAWDAVSGLCLRTYTGHTREITDVASAVATAKTTAGLLAMQSAASSHSYHHPYDDGHVDESELCSCSFG